jgi:hypothetical protein
VNLIVMVLSDLCRGELFAVIRAALFDSDDELLNHQAR